MLTYRSLPCCREGNCTVCPDCGHHITGWYLNYCPSCSWEAAR